MKQIDLFIQEKLKIDNNMKINDIHIIELDDVYKILCLNRANKLEYPSIPTIDFVKKKITEWKNENNIDRISIALKERNINKNEINLYKSFIDDRLLDLIFTDKDNSELLTKCYDDYLQNSRSLYRDEKSLIMYKSNDCFHIFKKLNKMFLIFYIFNYDKFIN